MNEVKPFPPDKGYVRSGWLKRAAIALVLGIILTGCASSVRQGDTESTPSRQPTVMSATAIMDAQTPNPATSSMPYAVPEELPSKGLPEAKVILVEFTGFH